MRVWSHVRNACAPSPSKPPAGMPVRCRYACARRIQLNLACFRQQQRHLLLVMRQYNPDNTTVSTTRGNTNSSHMTIGATHVQSNPSVPFSTQRNKPKGSFKSAAQLLSLTSHTTYVRACVCVRPSLPGACLCVCMCAPCFHMVSSSPT